MARSTSNSLIGTVSGTVKNAIRLISKIVGPTLLWHQQSFFKSNMTSATEFLCQLICVQLCGIEDLKILLSGFYGRDMVLTRTVTPFACYPGLHPIEL